MDPLVALPTEVLLRVCRLLPLADRARLSELSRGWRAFADDEALWHGAVLDLPRAMERASSSSCELVSIDPDLLRILFRAPSLDSLVFGRRFSPWRNGHRILKRIKIRKVRKLAGMPLTTAAAVSLLRRLGPHLEELHAYEADADSLDLIAGMERLRVLHLDLGESLARYDVDEEGCSEWEEDEDCSEDSRSSSEDDDDDHCEQENDHDQQDHKEGGSAKREALALPPGLLELRLNGVSLDLLRVIGAATTLRKLRLTWSWCFHGEHLLSNHPELPGLPSQLEELEMDVIAVEQLNSLGSMPALRSLTLHGMLFTVTSCRPAPGQCRLRCLGVSYTTWRNPLVRSLMRSHAATIEELQLACCSSPEGDFFIPKLGSQLRKKVASRLPELRRVLLRRDLIDPHIIKHDAASCRKQLQDVRTAFNGTDVTVGCSECG